MNIIIVAGSFNDAGGKKSGWADKLHNSIQRYWAREDQHGTAYIYNGGSWEDLVKICDELPSSGIVLWLADVPNDKPKLVKQIKERNNKLFLVISKRNLDETYGVHDLVSRALAVKANLLLEITGSRENLQTSIIDPLGNVFLFKEANISRIAFSLTKRLETLISIKRIGSRQVGDAIPVPNSLEISGFLEIVKAQAEVFHKIIHEANTTRMLGNASFRCERGFPSFKNNGIVFVSQRNIDKRFIGPEAFVAVRQGFDSIEYFGPNKPSVDTPVQLDLYKYYPGVRFMLHSHTYISGAPYTRGVLPCGAIEEVDQILDAMPFNITNFCVNIKGHGSICFSDNLDYFQYVQWCPRPSPEIIKDI